MKRLAVTVLGCLLLLSSAGCQLPQPSETERAVRLEPGLTEELERLRLAAGPPGASLAVILPQGTEMRVASGIADPEHGYVMTPASRMFTGSAGKTFVAAVTLQLAAEGRLELDAPIRQFFADEPWFPHLPNGDQITIRNLLSHTSGLPRYVMKEEFWAVFQDDPDRRWRPVEQLELILDEDPVHPVGDGWHYSDTNYLLVGMIIEQVTGKAYYEELDRRIIQPLGLSSTGPSISRMIPGLAVGQTGDHAPPAYLPPTVVVGGNYVINPQFEWTGGGLVTTARDLAAWAKALYGGDVLAPPWREQMLTAVATGDNRDFRYGLGVFIRDTAHGPSWGHGGIMPGYHSQMEYFPDLGIAIALQVNADRFSGKLEGSLHDMVLEIVDWLAGNL